MLLVHEGSRLVTFIFTHSTSLAMKQPWRPLRSFTKNCKGYKTSSILHWAALQTTLFRQINTTWQHWSDQWRTCVTSSLLLRSFPTHRPRLSLSMFPFIIVKQSTISVQAKDILRRLELQPTRCQSEYQALTYDKAKQLLFTITHRQITRLNVHIRHPFQLPSCLTFNMLTHQSSATNNCCDGMSSYDFTS